MNKFNSKIKIKTKTNTKNNLVFNKDKKESKF